MIYSLAARGSRFAAIFAKWLTLGCLALPAGWAAESAPVTDPAVFPPDIAVQSMFRKALTFRVAQAASVPISVANAATFEAVDSMSGGGLTSNTFGTVFSPTSGPGRLLPDVPLNNWGDDFVGGKAPTSLNGVRVLVNGKESFVSFIGRGERIGTGSDQINFVTPDDTALGPVSIEIFQGQDKVAASMVNRRGVASPGIFAFASQNGAVFAAAVSLDGKFIAPVGIFGPGLSRPAASREIISIFGAGYGATDPPVPAGEIVTVLSAIPASEISATVGGLPATVFFGGLAPNLAGLYQFNIEVPQLPNGNHIVTIGRSGINNQAGLSIPVQNP